MKAGPFLQAALTRRWKSFRKRVEKGLPRRGRRQTDEAVHDLRTASRRLLSVLDVVKRVHARKAARRLGRRVGRVLRRLGALRDLSVQREMLPRLASPSGRSILQSFERKIDEDWRSLARKTRRSLRREDLAAMRDDKRTILRRLRRGGAPADDADSRQKVLEGVQAAAASLRARRASLDPTRVETLHAMRIDLKNLRYLLEAFGPLVPGQGKAGLQKLHGLQTTLGDLHDLEVLSSSLARHAKKRSARSAAALAPVLAEIEAKHSAMLQSFLKSADPVLDRWHKVLAAKEPNGQRTS